jgi:hypothetical protein
MPKATGPASIKSLERLHRNAVRALNQELERISKAKEPVPTALLNAATAMLKVTGVVEPKRSRNRTDRLASMLDGYQQEDENGNPTEGDPSTDFTAQRELPEDQ